MNLESKVKWDQLVTKQAGNWQSRGRRQTTMNLRNKFDGKSDESKARETGYINLQSIATA